jgi:hypothetical protein
MMHADMRAALKMEWSTDKVSIYGKMVNISSDSSRMIKNKDKAIYLTVQGCWLNVAVGRMISLNDLIILLIMQIISLFRLYASRLDQLYLFFLYISCLSGRLFVYSYHLRCIFTEKDWLYGIKINIFRSFKSLKILK